jgi:hypothetical protein
MSKRLFDVDPLTGTTEYFHYDEEKDAFTIQTQQDVTDLVEHNKGRYNTHDSRAPWKGDLHLVASIPMNVYMELKQQGIIDDPKALRRWLNDPDNRYFRTRPGRV